MQKRIFNRKNKMEFRSEDRVQNSGCKTAYIEPLKKMVFSAYIFFSVAFAGAANAGSLSKIPAGRNDFIEQKPFIHIPGPNPILSTGTKDSGIANTLRHLTRLRILELITSITTVLVKVPDIKLEWRLHLIPLGHLRNMKATQLLRQAPREVGTTNIQLVQWF